MKCDEEKSNYSCIGQKVCVDESRWIQVMKVRLEHPASESGLDGWGRYACQYLLTEILSARTI